MPPQARPPKSAKAAYQISISSELYEILTGLKRQASALAHAEVSFGSVIRASIAGAPTLAMVAERLGKSPRDTAEALASRYGPDYINVILGLKE